MIIRRGGVGRAFVVGWTIAAIVGTVVLSMFAATSDAEWNDLSDQRLFLWAARDVTGILGLAVLLAASISSRATKALEIRGSLVWTAGACAALSLFITAWTYSVLLASVFGVAYLGFAGPLIGCGLMLAAVWGWFPTVIRQSRFYRSWLAHAPRSLASDTPTAS
ncbi:MAG: hypothetical protein SFY96_10055 [Planctomycetota bacterium]|nr:hypothetical protein [Planctomycetota bacterium]